MTLGSGKCILQALSTNRARHTDPNGVGVATTANVVWKPPQRVDVVARLARRISTPRVVKRERRGAIGEGDICKRLFSSHVKETTVHYTESQTNTINLMQITTNRRTGRPPKRGSDESTHSNLTVRLEVEAKNLLIDMADGYDMSIAEYITTLVRKDAQS